LNRPLKPTRSSRAEVTGDSSAYPGGANPNQTAKIAKNETYRNKIIPK
jgi:hypothetical protein